MAKKFNGNSSKNARIKIDYRDKNPKVNFSYPSKKHQKEFSMFPKICICWIIIWLIFMAIFTSSQPPTKDELNLGNHTQCLTYFEDYKNERCEQLSGGTMKYFNILYEDLKEDIKDTKEEINSKNIFFFLLLVIPPLLIYFPFRQRWKNYFPKHQAKMARKKLVVFKPKDIKKDDKGYFVEIPVFNNIILNYKTTKNSEFSKYLYLCEIREHNFKYVAAKKLKGDEKKKKEINDEIWYARFSFSDKPTTGQLKVLFR